MGKEQLEKRFGVIAVEKGFVSADQVMEAIKVQVRDDMEKKGHRLLGTILVEMGFMSPSQVEAVLEEL